MPRKGTFRRDPVEAAATADMMNAVLSKVIEAAFGTINRVHFHLFVSVLNGASYRAVAKQQHLPLWRVREICNDGMTASARKVLEQGIEITDLADVIRHVDQSALREQATSSLIRCPNHGWSEQLGRAICLECPCEVAPPTSVGGRIRRYCSNSCRQKGYRRRRREDDAAMS